MQSHLDQLIQRLEQIVQQLQILELCFVQSQQHCIGTNSTRSPSKTDFKRDSLPESFE